MTDESAMNFVVNGDLDKAAILYQRYKRPLFNFFIRFGVERNFCQDLTQQTFYRLIHYRHTFREGHEFKTWIYRIARNLFHDYLKDNHLNISSLDENIEVFEEENTDDEQHKLVQIALQKLSPDYREVLQLSRYENLKYEQIADMLNVSVSVIKVRVHRAIKQLREIYLVLELEEN